ncbi:ATP-grasp domain-containing protein [Streptomyces sp. NBC_00483]|uniref:ATP-grasp domain-containing protein n=1 Tax=Streptomyces sp. NBC_00483 TaxID=2975756 RepID=UPI002E16CB46
MSSEPSSEPSSESAVPQQVLVYVNLRRTPLEQRSALYAAHRLGYGVALIADAPPAGLPTEIVRTVHQVDTYDDAAVDAAVSAITAEFDVVGVVTWSDAAVETVSRIAQGLGLPAASTEAARISRDKFLMRQALTSVRPDLSPRFARVTTWEETAKAAAELGFPLVLKPATGNGSKGIYQVHGEDELRPAFEQLTSYVRPEMDRVFTGHAGEIVIEQFLAGTEHSIEGWVQGGQVHIAGITDKTTTEPYRLEAGHAFPTSLPEASVAAVHELTHAVAEGFGMDDCAFHLEAMVGPDGKARMVECAARVGGDFITSHLVGLATGVPFCENTVRVATGQAPRAAEGTPLHSGLRKLLAPADGVLASVEGVDDALRVPGVEHIVVERKLGATVQLPPADYMSSTIGVIIATGGSAAAVQAALDAAEAAITIGISDADAA